MAKLGRPTPPTMPAHKPESGTGVRVKRPPAPIPPSPRVPEGGIYGGDEPATRVFDRRPVLPAQEPSRERHEAATRVTPVHTLLLELSRLHLRQRRQRSLTLIWFFVGLAAGALLVTQLDDVITAGLGRLVHRTSIGAQEVRPQAPFETVELWRRALLFDAPAPAETASTAIASPARVRDEPREAMDATGESAAQPEDPR